jgi:hypothetical protein
MLADTGVTTALPWAPMVANTGRERERAAINQAILTFPTPNTPFGFLPEGDKAWKDAWVGFDVPEEKHGSGVTRHGRVGTTPFRFSLYSHEPPTTPRRHPEIGFRWATNGCPGGGPAWEARTRLRSEGRCQSPTAPSVRRERIDTYGPRTSRGPRELGSAVAPLGFLLGCSLAVEAGSPPFR